MAAPAAAGGAVLKQLAWTVARRQGSRLLRTFWKAIAVSALILLVAPIGLVVMAFLALAQLSGGGAIVTGYADGAPGSIACPVVGAVVTQGFGPTSAPFEPPGFGYPHFHTGIDFAAPLGTPVRAANDGVVEVAGTMVDALGIPVGFGNYIKVAVGGSREEIYGHLSAIFVAPNQVVRAGELIGGVGSTGSSTGPHLHFEVRVRGVPVNPSAALQC